MVSYPTSVLSETDPLKKVLLHRPGKELENLMPEYLERQLFDDIPDLFHACTEHDSFADTLRDNGVEVLYLLDLVAEAIETGDVKNQLVEDFIAEAGLSVRGMETDVCDYLLSLPVRQMLDIMVSGVRKNQLAPHQRRHLADFVDNAYPFLVDPMPNMYFTRDAFFLIGHNVCISRMANKVRHRETLFGDYLFRYHSLYKNVQKKYLRTDTFPIEGGDILVLSPKVVAIGLSQRTNPHAVENLADTLLCEETGIERVLAIDIPKLRAYMHLDTVLTMVDVKAFTIHPSILSSIQCFSLIRNEGKLVIIPESQKLEHVLANALEIDAVTLVRCGGNSTIDASREQWNDGTNTLAIKPGEVIAFSRNYVTNRILRDHGIVVHEIPSAELSRGRGGPRCMSMPFYREKIT